MTLQLRTDHTTSGMVTEAGFSPDSRAAWCDDLPILPPAKGGFAAEARIDTPYGPVPAGMLRPGHRVLTRDAGPQTVRWVGRSRVVGRGRAAPIHFPAGALGATSYMRVSRQHRILVAGQDAEPEVLVPAAALLGRGGIHIAACDWVTYVHVLLEAHHVISAEGVACDSLLIGPVSGDPLDRMSHTLPDGEESAIRHRSSARPVLSVQGARDVLERGLMPESGKSVETPCHGLM